MRQLVLTLTFLLLTACGRPDAEAPSPAEAVCCATTFVVTVPPGTGTVYLAGNLDSLGPWRADGLALEGEGTERRATLVLPPGTAFEYKFTLGSWDREALGPSGMVMPNHRLTATAPGDVRHEIGDFKKDVAVYLDDWQGAGVEGTLVYWRDVPSAHLDHARHVSVWLPPGYDADPARRYRVLYMSDGQNLFDPRIANTGTDWGVDEAVMRLVRAGVMEPVIVVGVWSSPSRGEEYSPWHGAPRYAQFLREELMPRVNAEFRTVPGPAVHMGSSMGGLLSYYLVTRHPDLFAACGCVSTHFPLSEEIAQKFFPGLAEAQDASAKPDPTPYILRDLAAGTATLPEGARFWFDYGTLGLDAEYAPTHAAVRDWLLGAGRVEGVDFVVRAYPDADHNEASWRARLDDPLTFLFGKR